MTATVTTGAKSLTLTMQNQLLFGSGTVASSGGTDIQGLQFQLNGTDVDAGDTSLAFTGNSNNWMFQLTPGTNTYTLKWTGAASGPTDAQLTRALQHITISDVGTGTDHNIHKTVATVSALNASNHVIHGSTATASENVICFLFGTRIATPDGDREVQDLKIGDYVLTADGAVRPVKWLGIQTVSRLFADPNRSYPIRVRANAIADNVPSRDLLVSPDHALLIDGALVHAGALINGTSITREMDLPALFKYFHVELVDHSLILAENTPAETFVDNVERMSFDNWAEHEELYGDDEPAAEMHFPRAKSSRQVQVASRVRLATRGSELYGDRQAAVA